MKGFIAFIKEQGVVGLAVGFILGGAVSKLVTSLVEDIIDPVVGWLLGHAGGLDERVINLGDSHIRWGALISTFIDFVIIAAVVYFGVKWLKLDQLDSRKSKSLE